MEIGDDTEKESIGQRLSPVEMQPDRTEIYLADIARGLYRDRWMIGGIAVAVIIAAAILTVLQATEYESEAIVQIHAGQLARSSALSDLGAAIGVARRARRGPALAADIPVVQSHSIIEDVADSLTLHVQLTEPATAREAIFSAVYAPRNVVPATIQLRHRRGGVYTVDVVPDSEDPPPPELGTAQDSAWDAETAWQALFDHPKRVEIGEQFEVGNVALTLDPVTREAPPDRITVEIRDFRKTVEALQADLHVSITRTGARVIRIGYRSPDPILVAGVSNAIANRIIRHTLEAGRADNRSRIDFLREQVASYAIEVAKADARLRAVREQEQIVYAQAQTTELIRHYAELLSQRDEIHQERAALQRLLARLPSRTSPDSAQETYHELAAVPLFFTNSAIQDVIRALIDLESRRADVMIRPTEQSIDELLAIDGRIQELELQLLETADDYLAGRENQLASLDAALDAFAHLAGQVPVHEFELVRLTRQQELMTEIYGELQSRLHEAQVAEAIDPVDVQLRQPARIPERPASPRPTLNLVLGVFLGIAMGLLAAFTRQIFDAKVKSSGQ